MLDAVCLHPVCSWPEPKYPAGSSSMESTMCGCWKRRGKGKGESGGGDEEQQQSSPWNLFIDHKVLEAATDNFSDANLLGQGGFGPVYKGVMKNGLEIAVKKLSLHSRQGVQEFTNEVRLLLKVQHRNLVSLLGCCVASDQKMLVYPYFPNRSLDHFLFGLHLSLSLSDTILLYCLLSSDKRKTASLDWSKRFEIIVGVAKGLLYLHEESPVKIIHRDIKASNILLDDRLNPKIADFGMARLFQGDDTHVNTFKVSGTYGYMAPEYALSGYLSAKADVFSFGVLMLEIVSGRKNIDKRLDEEQIDLLSYVSSSTYHHPRNRVLGTQMLLWLRCSQTWKLFEEGKALEIMDPSISTWDRDEAALCIQVALLCCQAVVSVRPEMHGVRLMLSSDSFSLPKPGRPGTRGREGRRTSTASSTLTRTSANSTAASTGTDATKSSSIFYGIPEDFSRNSISISFTTEGR
ncbi:STYKc [Musa troglodytarum]|uniref:STYKc n=1 Tax=Musa troglodytarum TaxID=320322 RepID=A0A9E7ECG1_9LILI|nr:STYKc [Musa troglodytarum]